ncbi:hypothetical protein DPMN_028644 [Dreissena polymorpha]|uniref:Uncharacterized protein n=1 Tax=Dreissena polymorpha TaxID=45954 RepID=A0A9D4RFI5_DREPO|nr:hypothetical protein DPMN_028644 [Dreissena polymorpha]
MFLTIVQAQYIIWTNLRIKFHEDRKITLASKTRPRYYKFHDDRTVNVASIVKDGPPLGSHPYTSPGGHVFKATKTIFERIQLHDDQKIKVTSRVLTTKYAPSQWWPYIIGMNLLTKFHDDWTINVASRVLTIFYFSNTKPYKEKCPSPRQPCFSSKDIIGTNLLSKFHEDRKIDVASRVLPRKNAPSPGSHVFQQTGIIFVLIQDIIGMNLLTKFHKDQTINVASRVKKAPPLGSHVFSSKHIIDTNLLTKFHEDWTINANVDAAERTLDDARRTKGDHKSSP